MSISKIKSSPAIGGNPPRSSGTSVTQIASLNIDVLNRQLEQLGSDIRIVVSGDVMQFEKKGLFLDAFSLPRYFEILESIKASAPEKVFETNSLNIEI